jgi:hypothetical protein
MSVKFETVKAGDVLYDVHGERMGNTTMRRKGVWKVRVLSVEADHAVVSWNGNPPRKYWPRDFKSLRRSEPKKLNGHLKGCAGYHDGLAWNSCVCDAIKGESK